MIVNNIALLLNNKNHNYLIIFDEIKSRYFVNFRKKNFSYIIILMTSYNIKKIKIEYNLLIEQTTMLLQYINV